MYEASFKGFNLYDQLTEDGIDCVVIPPHAVTEPKVTRVKTDKRDALRLALVLENHDFKDPCHVPDKERREDRQIGARLLLDRRILTTNSKNSSTEEISDLRNDILKTNHDKLHFNDMAQVRTRGRRENRLWDNFEGDVIVKVCKSDNS